MSTPPLAAAIKAKVDKAQVQAMREWAKSQGMDVSDRGRIAQKIQDAYHAAH